MYYPRELARTVQRKCASLKQAPVKVLLSGVTALALTLGALPANAVGIYAEVGDAGLSVATAQAVTVGTNQITGSLFDLPDAVDIFSFSWVGGALFIDGTMLDSNDEMLLWIFDENGVFIADNDSDPDDFSSDGPVALGASAAAGNYLLAVSGPIGYDGFDAINIGAFASAPDFGGNTPDTEAYEINFTTRNAAGAPIPATVNAPSSVPAPAPLALLAIGLLGVGLSRRRKAASTAA